ncbi:MAG: DinB family protein [Verrucomicrobia bacterium]|nr:DinB family protein [Verrucomicrobiota bacterium]
MNTLVAANLSCLQQGVDFLQTLRADHYRQVSKGVFNSTIGGHFRHNLDHYAAFLDGWEEGKIDYDARSREKAVETDPSFACERMREQMAGLAWLGEADLDQAVAVRMDDGGDPAFSESSLRRELQFLLSHTVHHYALTVAIATRLGLGQFPEGFGVAPSTLRYEQGRQD